MNHPWCAAALIAAVAAMAACAPIAKRPPAPFTLSYPESSAANFPDHRRLAEQVAPAYVRVTIYDKGDGIGPVDIEAQRVAIASGILVDTRGHLVTAAHIARDGSFGASIGTSDGGEHEGVILDVDPERELALIRIAPFPGIEPAVLGDSDALVRGELALAIGTPAMIPGVVSLGRVRIARRRTPLVYGRYRVESGIELTMDVASGHSGGPVFNAQGKVIGMVASYLLGDTTKLPYVSPGIAFAVPAKAIDAYLREKLGQPAGLSGRLQAAGPRRSSSAGTAGGSK